MNTIIEKTLYPDSPPAPPPPPVDNTPNFDDLNRTGRGPSTGSGMPSWDEMKQPDHNHSLTQGEGWKIQTWWDLKNYPRKDMELKLQRVAYGIDVFKIRQTHSDPDLHVIGSRTNVSVVNGSGDLQPNKTYVAVFNVWYWGEDGTVAYLADEKTGASKPSKKTCTYLPPSDGKSFPVRVEFKTDASGIGHIALFARGRCAAQLGEFYYVHLADGKR